MGDEPSTREEILEAIRDFPGIHFRGIVDEIGVSTSLLQYHLEDLLDEGEVRAHEVGGYTRYFPPSAERDLTEEEQEILEVLRQERPLEMVLELLDLGSPLRHKDLVEETGLSKGTVTYHLDKLRDAGVVRRVARGEDRGFHLEDPDQVRRLLSEFEPASSTEERVRELWDDLFGGHRDG